MFSNTNQNVNKLQFVEIFCRSRENNIYYGECNKYSWIFCTILHYSKLSVERGESIIPLTENYLQTEQYSCVGLCLKCKLLLRSPPQGTLFHEYQVSTWTVTDSSLISPIQLLLLLLIHPQALNFGFIDQVSHSASSHCRSHKMGTQHIYNISPIFASCFISSVAPGPGFH